MITVPKAPCISCPYRQDVPSGVWHNSEYSKLIGYDGETWEQPTLLFHCHTQPEMLCAGWVGCHDMDNNLAVRLHAREVDPAVYDYESPVPLFGSGSDAADHGRRARSPGSQAMSDKLEKLVERRKKI